MKDTKSQGTIFASIILTNFSDHIKVSKFQKEYSKVTEEMISKNRLPEYKKTVVLNSIRTYTSINEHIS